MRQRTLRIAGLAAVLILAAGSAMASDLWLHVRVEEKDGATVKVNLPVTMLEKAVGMIPEEHFKTVGSRSMTGTPAPRICANSGRSSRTARI